MMGESGMFQEIDAFSLASASGGGVALKSVAPKGLAGYEPDGLLSPAEFAFLEIFVHARRVGEPRTRTADVRRALLAKLLVVGSKQVRVVIDRCELRRLFGRRLDDISWEAFSPCLQVQDTLEDAIEYLQAETEKPSTGTGGRSPCICWFTTPDVDFDVVLQTLQHARNHRFAGLVLGPWPHGSAVYALEDATRPHGLGLSSELLRSTPAMTEEEAFRALTSGRT